jgi:ribosomal protein S18 acetylase RimI-like enzyme
MDPARDLGAIASLIANAFADEMDQRGRAALREMRWMARLSPLVWWWAQADPTFGDAFNGFVWEEPSSRGKTTQIVGNVSLTRAPGNRQRWIICNVVVRADYRRQGIGQQLVDAAIAEARVMRAVGVLLQVYQDNDTALQLYLNRGFQEAAGETDLRLETIRSAVLVDAPGYQIRAWQPPDGQVIYDLARLVIAPELQWLKPLNATGYQLDWWTRVGRSLADFLAGRRSYRLSATKDGQLVATMAMTASFRREEHYLELLIHPNHTGQVETALISRALHILSAIPSRPVRITVDKDHASLLKVLEDYGFHRQRTLLTLWKNF